MEERTEGKHARGTNIIPFSLHNIDEMLSDLDTGIGRGAAGSPSGSCRSTPGAYTRVTKELMERHARQPVRTPIMRA